MTLPNFELIRPSSLVEAAAALSLHPDARCLGGGTDLLVAVKQGLASPGHLVDLAGIEDYLRTIEEQDGGLFIGGSVTVHQLQRYLSARGQDGAVADATAVVASPVLQHMGTVAGNICLEPRCTFYNQSREWRKLQGFCLRLDGSTCLAAPSGSRCYAVSSADLPPALAAVGASVEVCGMEGGEFRRHRKPLEALYSGDGAHHLAIEPGCLVAGVYIPLQHGALSGYEKSRRRKSIDFPAAGVAVSVCVKDGIIESAKVVLGSLDSMPLVAHEAAERLVGERPGLSVINRAAEVLTKNARTVNNHMAGARYRKAVSRVMFRRLCERLCGL